MTTSNRMHNFKRLAEQISQGGKLLTSHEKIELSKQALPSCVDEETRFRQVYLVNPPKKKRISH
jgi:hypothetical protein